MIIMKRKKKSPTDADIVGFAAKRMKIGEFELFIRAYEEWYGEKPTEAMMEPFFGTDLKRSIAPFWARHYARRFLSDPELHDQIVKEKRVSSAVYFIPLILEYLLIMYYLVRA